LKELCGEIPLLQAWKEVETIEFDDLLVAITTLSNHLRVTPRCQPILDHPLSNLRSVQLHTREDERHDDL
jgi:hypothetical protein